jgi:hypothetical protein
MSVIVKGMKMPSNCAHCICASEDSRYCAAANEYIPMLGKPDFCPLVALPDKHGDLIDRSDLVKSLGITDMDCDKCEWRLNQWGQCKRGGDFSDACFAIEMAETIVEAEGYE